MMRKSFFQFSLLISVLLCACAGESQNSSITTIESTSNISSSKSESTSSLVPSNTTSSFLTSSSSQKETLDDFLTTEKCTSFMDRGYLPLYKDINFKNGFILSKTSTKAEGGPHYKEYLKYYEETKEIIPTWTLAQWGTRHDLYNNYALTRSKDGFTYSYSCLGGKSSNGMFISAKRLQLNSKTGEIDLELNAETEYDAPRKKGEDWPCILLSQTFQNNLIHIASSRSIVMEAEFEITKFEDKMGASAVQNLHAAQFVWYITLQNRNKQSKDYGRYIWLGVPLWDNRNAGKETELFAQVDEGTSAMMYNSSTRAYYDQSNNSKMPLAHQKAKATFEVMKVARVAYDYAISHGFLGSTEFEELYIGGTNFGFEVPGTYNIGVHIDNIGVYYK